MSHILKNILKYYILKILYFETKNLIFLIII